VFLVLTLLLHKDRSFLASCEQRVMAMENIEQEIIILKAVKELIDSMVNFELMSLVGNDPESNIMFKSSIHQKFFNIILVDFLSRTDKKGPIKKTSYLGGIREILKNPNFDKVNSINQLKISTEEFKEWLEQIVEIDIWLPSIDKETKLSISRISFLKMSGDISKHNYLRAVGVAEELKEILAKSGIAVDINEALLVLSEFYERFHTDILNYHSSTIAEFLNNIRWGIFDYLQPELQRSIVWESSDPPKYHYTYPEGAESEFAKTCYWELMNEVRKEPYMRRFKVTKWLKMRY